VKQLLTSIVIPGQPAGLNPESMAPNPLLGEMDSGLAFQAPRNDEVIDTRAPRDPLAASGMTR
jgi:hypothetical protein